MFVERPLSGVRILDFSRGVAGAYGNILIDYLGAEVIKTDELPYLHSSGIAELLCPSLVYSYAQ